MAKIDKELAEIARDITLAAINKIESLNPLHSPSGNLADRGKDIGNLGGDIFVAVLKKISEPGDA